MIFRRAQFLPGLLILAARTNAAPATLPHTEPPTRRC